LCKEQQDKRFEQEKAVLVKNYENELQSMGDQQNKQVLNYKNGYNFNYRNETQDFIKPSNHHFD